MGRPNYGEKDWPRDFPGMMYLGTFIRHLNVAMHRDAEREDVVLSPYFEDRPSSYDPTRLETFDEQKLPHQRAMMARGAALKAFRDGMLAPHWLYRAGAFQSVPADAWQAGASNEDLTRILVRFSLPDRMISTGEVAVFGNAPSLYVPAEQASAVIGSVNGRFHVPAPPSKILERTGEAAPAFDALWSLAAAVIWTATRDLVLARGANRYAEEMASRGFASVQDGALEMLARKEIAYHYCRCFRPVCCCWDDAVRDIVARALVGELAAQGFMNGVGNQDDVPRGAWSGSINFGNGASIAAVKPGEDGWTNITFVADEVMRIFPTEKARSDVAASIPVPPSGAWKAWAKSAVDRSVGIKSAHDDARAELGTGAPSRDQARELVREEGNRRGIVAKQGRRPN